MNWGFEKMKSEGGDAIAICSKRYVSFSNMLHNHISFQVGKGKNTLLISEEESASVRSADEKRTSSSLFPIRRTFKHYYNVSALQNRYIPQLDLNINIAHSSPTMNGVSTRFPNCLVAYLGDQDFSPPQNPQCQENMKQKMNIEGRTESIPSLHSIPSIQHSMNVKASSKSINIYDTNNDISGSQDRSQENSSIRSLGLSNQKIESQENSDMGGSLNLLVDAIQLLEGQELHKTIGRQIHKKVSIQALPKKMLRRLKNDLGKLSLQNHQCLVEDHGLESTKKLTFNKVIQSGDGQHSFSSISKVGEIEQGTMSFSRTKRGRLQSFPSKYSDSVLQPWKKISRKVQTC